MLGKLLDSLFVQVKADFSQFRREVASAQADLRDNVRKMGSDIEGLSDKFTGLGQGLLAITLPVAGFSANAIRLASDAQEMQSAFEFSFGEMSASVEAWAETTAREMGRSTTELKDGALQYQRIFSDTFDPSKAADMSTAFAELTQDVASFYNLTEESARTSIFSGLVGETEPLRRLGIVMSAASVEAKALEMGLAETKAELTEQAKMTARAQLIMEGFQTASGDVVRTSDSFANSTRALQASLADLSRSLGEALLPAVTSMVQELTGLSDMFLGLPPGVQATIAVVAGLAAAVGPLLIAFGALLKVMPLIGAALAKLRLAFIALGGPAGIVFALAGALGALALSARETKDPLDDLRKRIDGIKVDMDEVQRIAPDLFKDIKADAQSGIPVIDDLAGAFGRLASEMNALASTRAQEALVNQFGVVNEARQAAADAGDAVEDLQRRIEKSRDSIEDGDLFGVENIGKLEQQLGEARRLQLLAEKKAEVAMSTYLRTAELVKEGQFDKPEPVAVTPTVATVTVEPSKEQPIDVSAFERLGQQAGDVAGGALSDRMTELARGAFADRLALEDALALAYAEGDEVRAQSLRDQLDIIDRTRLLVDNLGLSHAEATRQAVEYVTALREAEDGAANAFEGVSEQQGFQFGAVDPLPEDEIDVMATRLASGLSEVVRIANGRVEIENPIKLLGNRLKTILIEELVLSPLREVEKLLASGLSSIMRGVFGGGAGGLFGIGGTIAGGLFGGNSASAAFGGFRALGGPVTGGTSYVVGERGPEIFTPREAGTIMPNGYAPAMPQSFGPPEINISINGAAGNQEVAGLVRSAVVEGIQTYDRSLTANFRQKTARGL